MAQVVLAGETGLIETWIFEADEETPAVATSVSWSYITPPDVSVDPPDPPVTVNINIAAPTVNVSLAAGSALSGMTGTYHYFMTNVNADGYESMGTPILSQIVVDQRITVTYPAADSPFTVRRVYRRKGSSTGFYLIQTLGAGGGSFSDTAINDNTNARIPSFVYGENYSRLVIESSELPLIGEYRGTAEYTKLDGMVKFIPFSFVVEDPLYVPDPTDDLAMTAALAWSYFEDCFDSTEGGPWLRDVSLRNFGPAKLAALAGSALYLINQRPPIQSYTTITFPYEQASPLFAKGMLIEGIKHLMRSYVEQPEVMGAGQISYFDRRNYLDRWNLVLQAEEKEFATWLALFKRGFYEFGQGKVLVDIKSGRQGFYWPGLRARYPRVFW